MAPSKCYGPYDSNFTVKSTGHGAAWHPGRQGHKLRGDAIAFYIASIMEDAAEKLHTILCSNLQSSDYWTNNNATKARRSLRSSSSVSSRKLLTSKGRKASFSNSNLQSHSISSQEMLKTLNLTDLNGHALTKIVIKTAESLNTPDSNVLSLYKIASNYLNMFWQKPAPSVPEHYDLPETEYPPQCFTDYQPRVGSSLSSILAVPLNSSNNSSWTKELSFFDAAAVARSEQRKYGYLDRKFLFVSHGMKAKLQFRITVRHESKLWICEVQKGFGKYPETMSDLHDGALIEVLVSGKQDMSNKLQIDLDVLSDQCYRSKMALPVGKHLLNIFQKGTKQVYKILIK